jgi:hypothetical protein
MDRPLWQMVLALLLVGFAVQRAAVGFVLLSGDVQPLMFVAYGLQVAAAVVTAVGMWLGRRWSIGALIVLGVALAATAILESLWLGVRPAVASAGEILVLALSIGALGFVLSREFRARDEGQRSAP